MIDTDEVRSPTGNSAVCNAYLVAYQKELESTPYRGRVTYNSYHRRLVQHKQGSCHTGTILAKRKTVTIRLT
jgi:hypothetical protein